MNASPSPRAFHVGTRASFYEPLSTASHRSHEMRQYDLKSGFDAQQEPLPNYAGRSGSLLHQPQPRTTLPPQTQYDIGTKPNSPSSGTHTVVQGPPPWQHSANKQSVHGNNDQDEQPGALVSVDWSSDDKEASECLDLSAPVQSFQDTINEVLKEYFELVPDLSIWKLEFSILSSKKSFVARFKDKNTGMVWNNIVKWMRKNPLVDESFQCKILPA
jgi:hypothetical protein